MEYLIQLAILCFAVSIYYKFQGLDPIIEQDGKYWVIRVNANYFVDADELLRSPNADLIVWEGKSVLYLYCRFPSKEVADLYFKHVCDYAAEGKISYGY